MTGVIICGGRKCSSSPELEKCFLGQARDGYMTSTWNYHYYEQFSSREHPIRNSNFKAGSHRTVPEFWRCSMVLRGRIPGTQAWTGERCCVPASVHPTAAPRDTAPCLCLFCFETAVASYPAAHMSRKSRLQLARPAGEKSAHR